MAARWSPSSSERMALWKNKKIRIGGLRAGLFFTQAFDGEGSMAFTGPAITATPPPPSRCWRPGNGVAISVLLRISDSGFGKPSSSLRFSWIFRVSFSLYCKCFLSLSLSRSLSLPLWFFVVCSSTRTVRDDKKRERFEYG
jgi:hypothetical protein